ncbi:hypothetical protein HPB50_021275 [Hyalomma asiaticum]|uniref:Uncharacterized protein n=1 Tax=Hyalomma asiaticum TaxID=266040 RepID=A0ACB7S151_HYAAI|nr:hypothetical protein HPB50_021275 [Hyalomma asiaticum]
MAAATMVTGYDPTSLQVVTMETTSSNQAMPSKNEYLADMVKLWERMQSQPCAGTGQKAAASGSSSRPSTEVARTAGSSRSINSSGDPAICLVFPVATTSSC